MTRPGDYHLIDAAIEPGETGYDDDGLLCQLITVTLSDEDCFTHPAIGLITAEQARELAFELLVLAEHADQLTRTRRERSR